MITPIALIKSTVLRNDGSWLRPHRHITSQSVKAPIASLELSNGARTGLTGAIAIIARKAIAKGVTINNILPGPFDYGSLAQLDEAHGRV